MRSEKTRRAVLSRRAYSTAAPHTCPHEASEHVIISTSGCTRTYVLYSGA